MKAHILLIVDRSGSMKMIEEDATGGIQAFLDEQRRLDDVYVTVSLAQFDHDFHWVVTHADLDDNETLTHYKIEPRGVTALLDAIGRGVQEDHQLLDRLYGRTHADKTVCVIVTDGQENASREWTLPAVKKLISEVQDEHGWEFVFLASDLGAIQTARAAGIPTTTQYDYSGAGMKAAYGATAQSVSSYLSGKTTGVEAAPRTQG